MIRLADTDYAILVVDRLPESRERLKEATYPVVLFLALASPVAHGGTIPVALFTPHIYRRTRSSASLASDGAADFLKSFRRANGGGGRAAAAAAAVALA